DRLERRRDLRVDGDAGDLAVALLEYVGEGHIELVAALLLDDLEPPQHDPASVGDRTETLGLEAVGFEEVVHLPPPALIAAQALVRLGLDEDRLHPQLEIGVQERLKARAATVELVIDASHGVESRAGVGLLHGCVELAFERLDVVLVVHVAGPQYLPTCADDAAPGQAETIGAIAEVTLSLTGEIKPAGAGGAAEQEIQTRLASIRVGLVLSIVVAIGSSVYALAT